MVGSIIFVVGSFLLGFGVRSFVSEPQSFRKWVNKFLIYVGLPLVVAGSFFKISGLSVSRVIVGSLVAGAVMITLSYFLSRYLVKNGKSRASLLLCSGFGNTAYLGIPVLYALFGEVGTAVATLFTLVTMPLRYTVGLFLASSFTRRKGSLKDFLRLPFFWTLVAAALVGVLLPSVPKFFSVAGRVSAFVAVFIVGLSMSFEGLNLRLLWLSLPKLFLMPLVTAPFFWFLAPDAFWPLVLVAAMPSAFINTALAVQFGFDDGLASRLTVVGTLVFMVLLVIGSLLF